MTRLRRTVHSIIPSRQRYSSLPSATRWKGVLAHLMTVPAWVLSPFVLAGALIQTGSPRGLKGVAASCGIGVAMVNAPTNATRMLACLALSAFAGTTAGAKKLRALFASGVVAFLVWMTTTGEFQPRADFYEFMTKYLRCYYAQAEMRGALADIKHGRSMFCFHPHGCLSAGFTVNGIFNAAFHKICGNIAFLIDPGLRHKNPTFRVVCDAYKGGPQNHALEASDNQGFKARMARGETIAFVPGGFQEASIYKYGAERAHMRKRKGFLKHCLTYGYRLHPVWTFGEGESYYAFSGLQGFRQWLSNYMPAIIFFGWKFCPVFPLPSTKIVTYVGPGIDLPKIENPTQDDIDHWHGIYIAALQRLFDEHKAEVGKADAQLEIW